jgi:hypothetical protein
MSSSSEETLLRLIVETGSPSEIFVIDGRYNLCKKGMERLECDLPPGLYKVKVRAGSFIKEVPVELSPENSPLVVDVKLHDLQIASAAPLLDTSGAAPFHMRKAEEQSRKPALALGQGCQLFVFCRDAEPGARENPAVGLTLCSANGEALADIVSVGQYESGDADRACAWCNLALDPGAYRLVLDAGEAGVLEQSLFLCPGWQTQLFLTRRSYGETKPVCRANLTSGAVLMAPLVRGFEAGREDLRWAEIARQRLAQNRTMTPDKMLDEMLYAKFQNPLLGIYGGHNLLLAERPDRRLIEEVYGNLKRLIGLHPDVASLGVWLGESGNSFPYPPMLRSSWKIIVQRSVEEPEIVPADSLAARISTRVWGGGAWLLWKSPQQKTAVSSEAAVPAIASASLAASLENGGSVFDRLQAALEQRSGEHDYSELDEAEQLLLRYLTQITERNSAAKLLRETVTHTSVMRKMRSRIQRKSGFLKKAYEAAMQGVARTVDDRISEEKLVQILGVPRSALHQAADGLQRKLKL